jgi:hypothetical protein
MAARCHDLPNPSQSRMYFYRGHACPKISYQMSTLAVLYASTTFCSSRSGVREQALSKSSIGGHLLVTACHFAPRLSVAIQRDGPGGRCRNFMESTCELAAHCGASAPTHAIGADTPVRPPTRHSSASKGCQCSMLVHIPRRSRKTHSLQTLTLPHIHMYDRLYDPKM